MPPGRPTLFTKPGAGWANATETAKLTPSDGAAGDWFGYPVAMDGDTVVVEGDTVVVGAYRDDDNGVESGSAYAFTIRNPWTAIPDSGSGGENAASYTLTGLTIGAAYTHRVRAVSSRGVSGASNPVTYTVDHAGTVSFTSSQPQAGTELTASLRDPDGEVSGVTWQWASSATAGGAFTDLSGNGADTASYTPQRGDVGRYLRATSSYTDAYGSGKSASAVSGNAVLGPVPARPTGLTATPGDEEVTLHWTSAVGNGPPVTGYQYKQDDGDWTDIPGGAAATTVTITGLTNGTAYNFRVRATNPSGLGAEATVTAIPGVPSAPANLTATPGDEEVTLRWTAAAGNGSPITGYQVQQDGGDWTDIEGSGASTTEHTVVGLTNGTLYTFAVRAVNPGGNSSPSDEVVAAPLPPGNLWLAFMTPKSSGVDGSVGWGDFFLDSSLSVPTIGLGG